MGPIRFTTVALFALSLAACGAPDPNGDLAQDPNGDLAQASQGVRVRELHEYLTRYGYFPNDQLAREYPAWRPIVPHAPARQDIFDETTAKAVSAFQRKVGLPQTGVVNQETRAFIGQPRCGVPDGMAGIDPSSKFLRLNSNWLPARALTWSIVGGTDELTLSAARQAVTNAFSTWVAQTNVSMTELLNNGSADIAINFANTGGGELASARPPGPGLGGNITFNTAHTWSTAATVQLMPPNSYDFESVVLHEIGHALGLDHSTVNARMFDTMPPNAQGRALNLDDRVAISTIYDVFTELPGVAQDIGVGANGDAWVIGNSPVGASEYSIHKWDASISNWVASDGGARRIAVGPTGVPWIVNTEGRIFRRTTASPTTGSWQLLPGLAFEIGVGANGDAWVIGRSPVGAHEFSVHKWNGTDWDATVDGGGGIKIAVGPTGEPWIANSEGNVFRRTTNSAFSGSWQHKAGPAARDIGISDGDYAWAFGQDFVTGGHPLRVWNEQQNAWILAPGVGYDISVGPNSRPWIVDGNGRILRTAK